MSDQIDAVLVEAIRRNLPDDVPAEVLADGADLAALGLTSFRMVNLLVDIETTFDVEFDDDALSMETFATPGTLRRVVSTQRSRSAAS